MGTVGGSNFRQYGTAFGQDFWNAKGAAYLDEFAARDQHFAAFGHAVKRQQHGSRIVVHDRGRLGTGEAQQMILDQGVAVPAQTRAQVVLKSYRSTCHRNHRIYGGLGQLRPPEVGVEYDPGGVDNGFESRLPGQLHMLASDCDNGLGVEFLVAQLLAGNQAPPQAAKLLANGLGNGLSAVVAKGRLGGRCREHTLHRR